MPDKPSRERVIEFLESRGFKSVCEACGTDATWLFPNTDNERVVGLFNPRPNDGGYVMPGGIATAYIMACQNCGHIRLFSDVMIDGWIKAEEEANGD